MIYLDANVIIRLLEGSPSARGPIENRLASETVVATSQLSRLECSCKPIRDNNQTLLSIYDGFFHSQGMVLIDIDTQVIDEATLIRATDSFKSPDSLQIASAIIGGAKVFLTGDTQLVRCKRITVEII